MEREASERFGEEKLGFGCCGKAAVLPARSDGEERGTDIKTTSGGRFPDRNGAVVPPVLPNSLLLKIQSPTILQSTHVLHCLPICLTLAPIIMHCTTVYLCTLTSLLPFFIGTAVGGSPFQRPNLGRMSHAPEHIQQQQTHSDRSQSPPPALGSSKAAVVAVVAVMNKTRPSQDVHPSHSTPSPAFTGSAPIPIRQRIQQGAARSLERISAPLSRTSSSAASGSKKFSYSDRPKGWSKDDWYNVHHSPVWPPHSGWKPASEMKAAEHQGQGASGAGPGASGSLGRTSMLSRMSSRLKRNSGE